MFLFLRLVLQPGLRAGGAWLRFGAALRPRRFTHRLHQTLHLSYICLAAALCLSAAARSLCACLCLSGLLRLWSHVGCSQLCSVASVLAGTGDSPRVQTPWLTHTHTYTHTCAHTNTRARPQGQTHTHTLTYALSLSHSLSSLTLSLLSHSLSLFLSLAVFVLPLADFVFADTRWADIASLLNNKYTLSLALSVSDISLYGHLALFTFPPSCNLCRAFVRYFVTVIYPKTLARSSL